MPKPKDVQPQPDLTGKTAIVTGANVGIGLATATHLAGLGCRIIMACRNSEKAEKAAEVIRATHPEAQVEVYKLDLQSLESARQFERDWQARNPTRQGQAVDLLICNAGAVFLESKRTPDGFEQTYQTNYLTHFLLIRLMLPYLRLATAPRVVCLTSVAGSWGSVDLDNLNAEKIPASSWNAVFKTKTGMQVYGNSKLIQMMSVIHLQKLLQASPDPADHAIVIHGVHPGFVASEMAAKDHYGMPKFVTGAINGLVRLFAQTTTTGCKSTLWAALSPEASDPATVGGSYFDDGCNRKDFPNKQCKDEALMQALYERTCQDVGIQTAL